jgi:hypothetical protein
MDPDTALRFQIARYRQMSGEERLAIGLRLHELACAMTLEGIRRQNPNATERELRDLLQRRLALTRNP